MPRLLQKLLGKGDGGWRRSKKGGLCVVFWLTRRSRVRGKKMRFGASYSTSNKVLFVARHILTTNVFKVGSVKFAYSLSPPSIVKKVRTGSKNSQGT